MIVCKQKGCSVLNRKAPSLTKISGKIFENFFKFVIELLHISANVVQLEYNKNMADKKTHRKAPKVRNWHAVDAQFRSSAGAHSCKRKYSRKAKHKRTQEGAE